MLLSMVEQEAMFSLGNLYKVNPPLRTDEDRLTLMQYLIEGKIDWIETDQAMHTLPEKILAPYMSGIPSLLLYNDLIETIRYDVSPYRLGRLTFGNIVKDFSPKLKHLLHT
ncbi:MAG: hypothetical protein NT094_03525 [Candidatus Staskawiczbacteria bacterium]|nr:hypothetical protein [Candidatus Staskawiczbacteria bacterium]